RSPSFPCLYGQREVERAAVAGLAFGPQAAAVQLCEPAGERKSEAGAFSLFAGVGLFELLEDRFQLVGWDAGAAVGGGDLDMAVVEVGGDVDAAVGRGELDRVGEEVDNDLTDAALVGRDSDLLRLGLEREVDSGAAGLLGVHGDGAAQDVGDRDRGELE